MAFDKITSTDLQNKGVIGLADTPGLTTTAMQQKFDEIALDVIVPKFNALIDDIESAGLDPSTGDVMHRSVYDTDNDGIVDNAEKVNNHTVECDVPEDAVFTDTVYDDTEIREEIAEKADADDIPTKTSDLTNDSGFITSASVPTKTSELTNDSGFITSSSVPTKTSQLTNDSGFITSSAVPTKTSQLTNDSGFITASSVPSDIDDLSDVSISSPSNGQVLGYNSSTQKWENTNAGTGTGDMTKAVYDSDNAVATAGGIKSYVSSVLPDVTGKADKVSSATDGNFAGLDSNGNLTDSGHKHSDYLTSIPIASANDLGGIKVGNNLSIDANGVLSATGGSGGATSLAGLDDVSLSSQSDGQVLAYDNTSSKWKNASLGTASKKDVPASGNATSSQVVMGNDTRLSDARTPVSHTHTKSEITDFPTIPTVDQSYSASSTNAQSGTAVADAISGKADSSALDGWTSAQTLDSNKSATWSNLDDSLNVFELEQLCETLDIPKGTGKAMKKAIIEKLGL